jgi:hypothetical protein
VGLRHCEIASGRWFVVMIGNVQSKCVVSGALKVKEACVGKSKTLEAR